MDIKCPYCQTSYDVEHNMLDEEVECGVCHRSFIVESPRHWVDLFKRVISLKGRARRKEYWIYQAVAFSFYGLIVVLLVIDIACAEVIWEVSDVDWDEEYNWLWVFCTAINFLFIPIDVRRLHDCNWSGWWCLFGIVSPWIFPAFVGPVVGLVYWIVLGCKEGTHGDNQYGADPKGVK